MSGRRTSGTSRPSLGAQVLALLPSFPRENDSSENDWESAWNSQTSFYQTSATSLFYFLFLEGKAGGKLVSSGEGSHSLQIHFLIGRILVQTEKEPGNYRCNGSEMEGMQECSMPGVS